MPEFIYSPHIANLAYILFCITFFLRNIFYIRMIAIVAIILLITYFYFYSAGPMWVPLRWNLLFLAINVGMIIYLCKERYDFKFTKKEKELLETLFKNFPKNEFRRLMEAGLWKQVKENTKLIEEGKSVEELIMLYEGEAQVSTNKGLDKKILSGNFIGEVSFLSDKLATASVKTISSAKILIWKQKSLKRICKRFPQTDVHLKSLLGVQLAEKFKN